MKENKLKELKNRIEKWYDETSVDFWIGMVVGEAAMVLSYSLGYGVGTIIKKLRNK